MKYLNLIFIVLLLTESSFAARDKASYDIVLVTSIDRILREINKSQQEFCLVSSVTAGDSKKYVNCNVQEVKTLKERQHRAYRMIADWLIKIQEYEKGKQRGKIKKKDLVRPRNMLRCIFSKIEKARFVCKSKGRMCIKDRAAYTLPFVNTPLHLCPIYSKNLFNDIDKGAIIHELAHKCLATDAAYFSTGTPRSVGPIHWGYIADTYSFWARAGFCIPGLDCRPGVVNLSSGDVVDQEILDRDYAALK